MPNLAKLKEVVYTISKNAKNDAKRTSDAKEYEKKYGTIPNLEMSKTQFVQYTDEYKIEVIAEESSEKIKYLGNSEIKESEEGKALIKYKGKMYIVELKIEETKDGFITNALKLIEEVESEPDKYNAILKGSKVYEQSQDNGTINYESYQYNDKIYTKMKTITKNKIYEKETINVFEDYPDIYYTQN